MSTYSNRLQPAVHNLLRVVRFFHPRSSCVATHTSADVQWITLNASCMTISGERTEQLDIFCRITGFTSDFLSFIDVELIWFFHRALHILYCCSIAYNNVFIIYPWTLPQHQCISQCKRCLRNFWLTLPKLMSIVLAYSATEAKPRPKYAHKIHLRHF